MKVLSSGKAFVAAFLVAGLSLSTYAQEVPGPGGGQTPAPTPQPSPQPQPRQPNVIPTPQPTMPNQNQRLSLRGRIILGVQSGPPIVEVRFEADGGQPIGFAYADSAGEFNFQSNSPINIDQTVYVVVNLEGYKPYRERLFGAFGQNGFGGSLNIFLEREATVVNRGGAPIVDLKQLRAKIPGKAVDEYEKALKEATKGNRTKAVEGLQRAVKLAPEFYEAQHTLGVQFLAMQKFEDAENALTRARDLSPKAAEPLINLGSLYYQRAESQADAGRTEEAATTFQQAAELLEESIRRNPLSPQAHASLGAAFYKLGSYERAEETLNKALDLDENEHNARLVLINVYTRGARYTDALEQANIFLAKNPKAPQRASLEAVKAQIEKVLAT